VSVGVLSGRSPTTLWHRAKRLCARHPGAAIGILVIGLLIAVGLCAPLIAPAGPFQIVTVDDGIPMRLSPPSGDAWFGTTNQGMNVFAQVVWGTRAALIVGLVSAAASALVGTIVGLAAGYYGRWTDEILMRVTDVAFAIPFLPFAMVVMTLATPSLGMIVVLVSCFLWRTTARVVRAQVLSLKSRVFVTAARAAGASDLAIILRHIAPNILPLSFLYAAMGVQAGVMLEAALSFLGFTDPNLVSWGKVINDAFRAGAIRSAWWWILPPSLFLSAFVISVFAVTRAYEEYVNTRLKSI
jgi:peptide/nickel transport system permease protein